MAGWAQVDLGQWGERMMESMDRIATAVEELSSGGNRAVLDAALNVIQTDPHLWSKRPCRSCEVVSALLGRPFGCVLYCEQREVHRLKGE